MHLPGTLQCSWAISSTNHQNWGYLSPEMGGTWAISSNIPCPVVSRGLAQLASPLPAASKWGANEVPKPSMIHPWLGIVWDCWGDFSSNFKTWGGKGPEGTFKQFMPSLWVPFLAHWEPISNNQLCEPGGNPHRCSSLGGHGQLLRMLATLNFTTASLKR